MDKTKVNTMKAVVIQQDLSIKIEQVTIPKPQNGEVLIKVLAAPINQSDLFIFKNIHFFQKPKRCIPGLEGAGIVVENGGGLLGWGMLNKKVAFITQTGFTGSYGQYVIASTSQVVPIPSELSFEDASMSLVNPLTVIVMLRKVQKAKIKSIVNTAAASSFGRMMNRLFNIQGIPIINVVRREQQVQLLKKQGAKYVLNSQTDSFSKDLQVLAKQLQATHCFDAVSGQLTSKILKSLPPHSTIQIYGTLALKPMISDLQISDFLFNHKNIKGFELAEQMKDYGLIQKLGLIKQLWALLRNQLKSTIAKQYPLQKFEQGLNYYINNQTQGKVLIKPWQSEIKTTDRQFPQQLGSPNTKQ